MNIVLTGGGTAGHIMPNIALISRLKKKFEEIYYIGSSGMEKQMVSALKDVKFCEIKTEKLRRKISLKNLFMPFKVMAGINQAKKILKRVKPKVVFSKGGFVAVPVVIAAYFLGIPVVSHESDLSFGLANKIIYKFAKVMLTSFEETAKNKKKCMWIGTIIRDELFNGNKEKFLAKHPLVSSKKTILVMGGSLGAKSINNVVFNLIKDNKLSAYNVIHLVGKNNIDNDIKAKDYVQLPFVENPADVFDAANVVISRAGSNTIFELLALKKPMLLIPLSKAESRGDQIENAKLFSSANVAHILESENLNEQNLKNAIELIIKNEKQIKTKMDSCPLSKIANDAVIDVLVNATRDFT